MAIFKKWTLCQIPRNCICCGSKINAVKFLTSKTNVSMDNVSKTKYSDTLNLPKTKLPFRIETKKRTETDSFIYEKCDFSSLYSWQRKNCLGKEFIVHDGPPYANGKLHLGHALNKILKDITLRHKVLQGRKVHYVPGWDCHGLPIELKAMGQGSKNKKPLSVKELHEKAKAFAASCIADQKLGFKSWGIMANWDECYQTHTNDYVKNELKQFFKMYEKGYIYRAVKPVFWSPSSNTALAEAELEYNNNHTSIAITVRMRVESLSDSLKMKLSISNEKIYALIWTTTPWTLPMNKAICYNTAIEYSVIYLNDWKNELYILASEQIEEFKKNVQKNVEVLSTFKGEELRNAKYCHPVQPMELLPFLPSSHVTLGKGTGLVHTAPAHGPDDFVVALEHNIPVDCMVDECGCFMPGIGKEFAGLQVLSSGNEKVLDILKQDIIHTAKYVHSYPYDWRTKQPVIIRASQQWFVDTNSIKNKAIKLLDQVSIYPKSNSHVLKTQLENRPYWCISRQKRWGVPIPVLYEKSSQRPIISQFLIDHYCSLLEKFGSDFWWTLPTEKLVPEESLSEFDVQIQDIKKGKDILDIWFDSGISWSAVLNENVADLYLEGTDQLTGWFQSSLMTSVALREKTPYRTLFIHGFAVDGKGQKMSKSLGNVIDPQEIVYGTKKQPALGVDVLRWWVAAHGTQHHNVAVSNSLLNSSAETVQKIRVVLRFLLGNLYDLPESDLRDTSKLNFYVIDKYILHKLLKMQQEIIQFYECYSYNKVTLHLLNFISNDVSALYCNVVRDRLYCEASDSPNRRACQLVMKNLLEGVTHFIAPILPFLAEEIYLYHPYKAGGMGLFRSDPWKPDPDWENPDACNVMSVALKLRSVVIKEAVETNLWKIHAKIFARNDVISLLKIMQPDVESSNSELTELLQVSSLSLIDAPDKDLQEEFSVQCNQVKNFLCIRCRRFCADVENEPCSRCREVLDQKLVLKKLQ